MDYTESEVLQYIAENDVKFIKLFFTDIFGSIKSISVQPGELKKAFKTGISFDASAVKGFLEASKSDLFIVPDPATLSVLPWRPQHGRVVRFFCNVRNADGSLFEGDTRSILQKTAELAEKQGYEALIGTECEFYLFQVDEKGEPTYIPQDTAGYCDLAPRDKGENVRRDICLTLIQMDIIPEVSHHETGPGQQEVDFKYDTLLKAADNLGTFKTVVKTIAARSGLYASFMPKPVDGNAGSGLHINISLRRNGHNIFDNENLPEDAQSFIAGILYRIREITAFLNPLNNSYKRFGAYEAPKYVSWSKQNRSQLIRIPAETGERKRLELRSPDPACNQYLALTLILQAGLEGIMQKRKLAAPKDINLFNASPEELSGLETLPLSLHEALKLARQSDFIRSVLPEATINAYIEMKESSEDPAFEEI